MGKIRVFELARELNIPGKDLVERMRALGYTVENNFNVLEDDVAAEIKGKMIEPVTRVEKESSSATSATTEDAASAPRKRRIISARRSEEVHRIQESLGVSGPLPEDEKTREEVPPVEEKAEVEAEALVEGETEPAETTEAAEHEETVETSEDANAAVETEKAERSEPETVAAKTAPAKTPAAAPPEKAEEKADKQPEKSKMVGKTMVPRQAKMVVPAPVDVTATKRKMPESDRGGWKDMKKGRGTKEGEADRWRDGKKKAGGGSGKDEDWVRMPRRKSGKKGGRPHQAHDAEKHTFEPRKKAIRIGPVVTVSELAGALGVKAGEIIKKLMDLSIMATINHPIEGSTAEIIASEFDIAVEVDLTNIEDVVAEESIDESKLEGRPPIVTIMGHVDHGKTTLLDYIRSASVAEKEAGGITQHIGAYYVKHTSGDLVFLDTPGHEAFTMMRARGADITDVVVLVVAADDGIMPQTVEAIDHARAADVPIMVAINKIDRPGADVEKIKTQLMNHGLVAESFGGETVAIPVSAKSGEGVDQLLEMIQIQAEILELRAVYEGPARGFVIESEMDRSRGPVASVIVQRGSLKVGDDFVAGTTFGRVRAMLDDKGRKIKRATPAVPVEIMGYNDLPEAGDSFVVLEDEKTARNLAQARMIRKKETENMEKRRMHLEDFMASMEQDEVTTLTLILKADTQGSLEAIRASLEKEGNEQVRVNVIRAGVGGITETDISLAATTNSVVIGFNVRSEAKASDLARNEGIDVKTYTVIYDLINDVHAGLQGLLKPVTREEIIGHFEVRQVFSVPKEGQVVGGYITDGRLDRNCDVRVYRDEVLIHTGSVASLRRFKEDVQTVSSGYECGLRLEKYNEIKDNDLIEAFIKVQEAQKLEKASR